MVDRIVSSTTNRLFKKETMAEMNFNPFRSYRSSGGFQYL